jgi:FeS assembly SUF system protein
MTMDDAKALEEKVVEVLKETYDPEIPVNIYDLGMIYNIEVRPDTSVHVRMTLTSPMCPVAGSLPGEVETRIRSIPGVSTATVELVWDPPWEKEMISEAGKLVLNIF